MSMKRFTDLNRKQDNMKLMDAPMSRGNAACWLRLCAIEDILGDDYDLDRLRELVQADKEGRCVVLPCKVGDFVYVIDDGNYQSSYKPYIRAKEVAEISWKRARNGKDLGFGVILKGGDCNTSARYKIQNVGKTVFLSREEAEDAMSAVLAQLREPERQRFVRNGFPSTPTNPPV